MSVATAGRIDWWQVRAILRASLRMRLRTSSGPRVSRSGRARGLVFVLAIYAVMGFLVGSIAFAHLDAFTFAALTLAMTLMLTGSVLVAEASQILFNPREADLLGHRPIPARTLLVAKIADVITLTLSFALALNLGAIVLGAVASAAPLRFALAHLLSAVLIAVFAAGALVFAYAALMKVIGRDRLDGFLSWWQLAVTVVMIFGYQMIPRMIDRMRGYHLDPGTPGLFLLPPAWFASLESLILGGPASPLVVGMALTAVLVTFLLPALAIGRLATHYAGAYLALSETPARVPSARAARVRGSGRMHPLLAAWMRDPVERGVYRLASAVLRRDRDVRMRLYPSIGTVLVFGMLPLVDRNLSKSGPILALTLTGMLTASAMETLRVGRDPAAADIFRYAPLEGSAALFHGVRKAVLVGYVLPVFLILLPVLYFTIHDHVLLWMLLPVVLAIPTLSLIGGLGGDYLPFSVAPTVGRQGVNQLVLMIGGSVVTALIAGLALASIRYGFFAPLLAGEVALIALMHALLLKGIRARRTIEAE